MPLNYVALVILLVASACADPPRADVAADAEPVEAPAQQEVFAYRACEFAPPGELVPLPRIVPADLDPAAGALQALVQGVSEEERARGCASFFSAATAGALRAVERSPNGDTVRVDFRDFAEAIPADPPARSFLPPGVMAELTWTLFHQFSDIEAVRFSFDGDEQAFWTWVGGPGTEAQVYTRTLWEQV